MSVSVIIPAFNAAAYLAEAIESALSQTHAASSIIVVDDGSTDATAAVAENFADSVTLLRQNNSGVSTARNFGASQISANWLLFLDADDRLLPHAIATLVARADEGDFGVVYGRSADFSNAKRYDEHGNDKMQGHPPAAAGAAFWKAPIATPGAAIVKREVFEKAGRWNPRFNTSADRDLWCRTGAVSEFGFVDRVVVERRVHDSNMSSDKNRARRQAVEVQLDFLEWCAARGISTTFLATDERQIFERNVERALEERAFDAAVWISDQAIQRNVKSDTFTLAHRLAAMPVFARDLELKIRGLFK